MNNQSNRHLAKYRAASKNVRRFTFKSHPRQFIKWAKEAKRQWNLAIKYHDNGLAE